MPGSREGRGMRYEAVGLQGVWVGERGAGREPSEEAFVTLKDGLRMASVVGSAFQPVRPMPVWETEMR